MLDFISHNFDSAEPAADSTGADDGLLDAYSDAVMAAALREHAARGVVLLAGNGHVRRDLGVPRWLSAGDRARVFAVGFLEQGDPPERAELFDAVVHTARAVRDDPCAAFESPQPLGP